jgi:hypothetical protein
MFLFGKGLLKLFHPGQQTLLCYLLFIHIERCAHALMSRNRLSNGVVSARRFNDGCDSTSPTGVQTLQPFYVTSEAFGIFSQRSHSISPMTCGLMIRLIMLGRSAITQAPPSVFSHFARHNSNGTRTWSMIGRAAIRSFVFGGPTLPCEGLLRLM